MHESKSYAHRGGSPPEEAAVYEVPAVLRGLLLVTDEAETMTMEPMGGATR